MTANSNRPDPVEAFAVDAADLAYVVMQAAGHELHVSDITAFVRRYMPSVDVGAMEEVLEGMLGNGRFAFLGERAPTPL